jgi:hypothetical protein
MRWNQFRFENFLAEELSITATLPKTTEVAVVVDGTTTIYPVQGTPDPVFNSKIEFLHGPFWTFTDGIAYSSMTVEPIAIEAVKNQLKASVADARWKEENTLLDITIRGQVYKFSTNRETRNLLHNAVGGDVASIEWKVDGGTWIKLSRDEIQYVLDYILSHVQVWFGWEQGKTNLIDACADHQSLDALDFTDKVQPPAPKATGLTVTMRQARLALMQTGKLSAVAAALASLPEPNKTAANIEWEYSSELQRTKPLVVLLGAAIGLSPSQIDDLFTLAATL